MPESAVSGGLAPSVPPAVYSKDKPRVEQQTAASLSSTPTFSAILSATSRDFDALKKRKFTVEIPSNHLVPLEEEYLDVKNTLVMVSDKWSIAHMVTTAFVVRC